jgi:hypothetical protein
LQKHLISIYSKKSPSNPQCLTVLQWIATGYFWKFWRVLTDFFIPKFAQSRLNPYLLQQRNKDILTSRTRLHPPLNRERHNVIMLDGIECTQGSIPRQVLLLLIALNIL